MNLLNIVFLSVLSLLSIANAKQPKCPENISPEDNVLLPDEESCSSYIQCTPDGQAVIKNCPNDLYFNPTTNVCDWPSNVKCNNDEPKCSGPNALLPNKEDCSSFIQCSPDGTTVVIQCPTGLYFNPKKEECDYPQEVDCETRDNEKEQENNEINTNDETEYEEDKEISNEYKYCKNIDCPKNNKVPLLVPGPKCNEYCQCANGVAYEMKCPPGLIFNPNVEACDWAENYECIDQKEAK